jgi:hypothetical protein
MEQRTLFVLGSQYVLLRESGYWPLSIYSEWSLLIFGVALFDFQGATK